MKKIKSYLSLVLVLAIAFSLIPAETIAQNEIVGGTWDPVSYLLSSAPGIASDEGIILNSPSGISYDTRVSYEIVRGGMAGQTDADTRSAVVRFTLNNPGEGPVSFNYTVVSGSAEERHLTGTTSGTVNLSQTAPQRDVTIDIKFFADNPGEYNLPNSLNAFWSVEHLFYLYCYNIQNALFEGNRDSLTVPVPVESLFDYEGAYEKAVNTRLIDFNQVSGGTGGVYPTPESGELKLTAEISGDLRKMLDAGVFTHINLPQGYFVNESDGIQDVTYHIKAINDAFDPPREAFMFQSQFISLPAYDQTSFFNGEFTQELPVEDINLGPLAEGNGIYNKIDFIFDYDYITTPESISTNFLDGMGQYLQHQVSFFDNAPPVVKGVSTGMGQAYYGDNVPVTIEFSEPVYIDGITFKVDDQDLRPMEGPRTISQTISFLYQIGDEALDAGSIIINISDITGAVDLSGKIQEDSGSGSVSVDISFDPRRSFAYCAEASVSLQQGISHNMTADIFIPIKQDMKLSNWLIDEDRLNEGNISTAVKGRAITAEGTIDIPLILQSDLIRVTGLTGSFTAPENNTGMDVFYALEIYMDTGSGYELINSLVTIYTIQPLIIVDDESDITLDYTYWPTGDNIFVNAGGSLSLGYRLNVDATWVGSEYFSWSSSDEGVAEIDENGTISLNSPGEVYFTLTVTNPLSEDAFLFNSRTLSVIETQEVYLYVPNAIKNQDILIGSKAKISFSTNMTDRNNLYGGPGTVTTYTFTLYETEYDDGGMKKGRELMKEVLNATVEAPINSYTVPASLLTKATAKNQNGYILEISAEDSYSGITMTAGANIRVRQLPAKALLIRPESVFLLDNTNSFKVEFDIENKTPEIQYSLTVTKNNQVAPVKTVDSPAAIEPLTVSIGAVETNRLLDVYTVSLRAKNISDEAWSYDSYCIYVYNRGAMNMLMEGFPAPTTLTMDYDFGDEEVIYNINFLNYRSMIGRELIRSLKIDDRAYAWSAIADRVTWQVDGESVSLYYGNRRIGDNYNPVLFPGTTVLLRGEGAGSSIVTATHTLTGMTDSMNVTLNPLNDKLFLFRSYPNNVPVKLSYTNGKGQEKTVVYSGEVGVYEDSGIVGDVVFYPTDGGENVYDFYVLNHSALMANQKTSDSFDLYPINTARLTPLNYNVSLELFDEKTGEAYTDDLIIRGGVYFNDKYQASTTINGKLGNADQVVGSDEKGRYSLSFRPADFSNKLLASDELRYVIEVGFADNSHQTQYITIENDVIQAHKASPLGVYLNEGIKALDASSIQNSAIVLSQTLTIDGEETSINDRIYLKGEPQSAILNMTVIVPQYSRKYYRLIMSDSSGGVGTESLVGEFIHAYPFSDTVTLNFVCDFTLKLKLAHTSIKPGDMADYYPIIRSTDGSHEIKLSKLLQVQNLRNIPAMDRSLQYGGDLSEIYRNLYNLSSPENFSFSDSSKAVKDALEIMEDYSVYSTSIGLEVKSTDDPLVYKGIIRFAAGSYSKDNPSGVFVGSGEKTQFSFMPAPSDIKAMAKGTFLKKAKESMNDSRSFYKTYGGGAYMECLVYYSIEEGKWKISLMYGDFYLGGGGIYRRTYNGWVSFVPVTATFQFSVTAELGLTILNSQVKNETAYIPRLRPVFSIYGFGGVGFDYTFTGFKAGPYGFVQHEQNYLWYTDSNGLKMDGQQLKIFGEVGVEFDIWLTFVKLSGKYVLADYTKSWEYNDYNSIQNKIKANLKERGLKGFLVPSMLLGSSDSYMMMLVPVEETATFEDRSYLEAYERFWGSPSSGMRVFDLSSAMELTDIWTNAYPNATPQLSDDGELMVYLSDMGSKELSDTAVLFAVKDATGAFSTEGTEINPSNYPDSSPFLSGTKEGASAVWIRSFSEIGGDAGSEATIEDVINGLAASEVMAGIYKDGVFVSTRLTNNENPDFAPVTAASGNRAIAAWRSVTLGDMDNPLDFTSDYIMYSIYDGSDWKAARYLYDGSIERIGAINTAMLPDGTSAIVYQITEADSDSEIICAILDTNGEVVRTLRLTDNMTDDVNPQITTGEFSDGTKGFIIGWNAETEKGEGVAQILSVTGDGTLYPGFSLELYDSTGATDYSNFRFTKGADKLEDLSLIWSEPEAVDKDGTYKYSIFGTKLIMSADNILSVSGKQKLISLGEGRGLDSLDFRVDSDTGKVDFLMLLSELSGASTLSTYVAEYKNILNVEEPYYEYEDLLPGLDMPVMFTVKNDGIDAITHVTIELGGQSFEFVDQNIASGEIKNYLICYLLPETLVNANFSVIAQFGESGETGIQTGVLRFDLPDVGIYQIDSIKETQRQRSFRVLLQNKAFADLKKGIHTVKLEIWDNPDFTEGSPLKTLELSGDDLDGLNNSLLSLDVILTEEDLQWLLDENGEIPYGGGWLIFRVVLAEEGNAIEDADISNDIDFVNIRSLIEKNGTAVSLTSLFETIDGKTTLQVEAINNSFNTINNGNIIVTLRDEVGNVLERQQTYNSAASDSLLVISGEESKMESVIFNRTGYTADVTFGRVSGESSLISVLNLKGAPMVFNPNVFEYNLKTYDLNQTIITAVAENPESTISVTKNGTPVSIASPIAMSYGTTVFVIRVTTGETETTYRVTVENRRFNDDTVPRDDETIIPNKPKSSESVSYSAVLKIGGIKLRDLNINVKNGRAVIYLDSLAQEIFSGSTEATLEIPPIPGVEGYTLEVEAKTLADSYTGGAITVSTELGSIRIPAGMLKEIAKLEGKTAGINMDIADKSKLPEDIRGALGNRPVISLTLTLDGEEVKWNNINAPVTVTIPYTPTAEELENHESIIIWYIDGHGKAVQVTNSCYDIYSDTVTFTTTHFSHFAVGYNKVSFKDIADNAWYKKAVSFIAARGITSGTGNGNYSPETILTRGQFIVLLMRAYSISADENPKDNFSDGGNTYYTDYLSAAKRLGISAGVGNNMFAPDNEITRQEMFTMLYNALKVIGQLPEGDSGKTLLDFTDGGNVSAWANEAMEYFVKTGIVVGNNSQVEPRGAATRGQMAQMLYNLMTK